MGLWILTFTKTYLEQKLAKLTVVSISDVYYKIFSILTSILTQMYFIKRIVAIIKYPKMDLI